jgi:Ca2+/H+ antiporter
MPKPIADAGTLVLIIGGALGLDIVMLIFSSNEHPKQAFEAIDLVVIAFLLLAIFVVYFYKLVRDLGKKGDDIQATQKLTEDEMPERHQLAFKNVERSSLSQIMLLLALVILGAFFGAKVLPILLQSQ